MWPELTTEQWRKVARRVVELGSVLASAKDEPSRSLIKSVALDEPVGRAPGLKLVLFPSKLHQHLLQPQEEGEGWAGATGQALRKLQRAFSNAENSGASGLKAWNSLSIEFDKIDGDEIVVLRPWSVGSDETRDETRCCICGSQGI